MYVIRSFQDLFALSKNKMLPLFALATSFLFSNQSLGETVGVPILNMEKFCRQRAADPNVKFPRASNKAERYAACLDYEQIMYDSLKEVMAEARSKNYRLKCITEFPNNNEGYGFWAYLCRIELDNKKIDEELEDTIKNDKFQF